MNQITWDFCRCSAKRGSIRTSPQLVRNARIFWIIKTQFLKLLVSFHFTTVLPRWHIYYGTKMMFVIELSMDLLRYRLNNWDYLALPIYTKPLPRWSVHPGNFVLFTQGGQKRICSHESGQFDTPWIRTGLAFSDLNFILKTWDLIPTLPMKPFLPSPWRNDTPYYVIPA